MPGVELPMALHRFLKGGHWFPQFVRFGFVGLLNTAFGYGVYAAAILVGLAPSVALLISTPSGVFFNFFTTGKFVFGNRSLSLLPRFILANAVLYVLNVLLLQMFLASGSPPLLAQIWCVCVIVPLTFVIFHQTVFRQKSSAIGRRA